MSPIDTSTPRLIGIGVGPGDPELVTVKALNALDSADVILVPATESRSATIGRAEQIVMTQLPHKEECIVRIPFSMAERSGRGPKRLQSWQLSASKAVEAFNSGAKTVAFATIGDPSVYSTFSYLSASVREHIADLAIEIVPGITAMQALAAQSRIPLCEGKEILALIPATVGSEAIEAVGAIADSITIYKGGRTITALKEKLDEMGRLDNAVLGSDIGLKDQKISPLVQMDDESLPYFSTIICPPTRQATGGQL